MPQLVLAVGVLIICVSFLLMVRVESMGGLLERVLLSHWRYGAALLRLLLGTVLIASADTVAFPGAVALFGWLFVLGGLALVVVPDSAMRPMVGWFARLSPALARLWLSAALVFGLFFLFVALV
jgi:hypothetical protein